VFDMKVVKMVFYFIKNFPGYVLFYFLNDILLTLPNYVGNVLFLKYIVQALLNNEPISRMLIILFLTAMFLILSDLYISWFMNKYKPCAEEKIQKKFYYNVRNAAEKYEFEVYDNPKFYDDMTYVNANIVKDSLALFSYGSKIVAELINILLIINLFYSIGLGVLIISVIAVTISLLFEVPIVKIQNKRKYYVNSIERKRGYFRNSFFVREYLYERKMSSIEKLLHKRYEESIEKQKTCEKNFGWKLFLLNTLRDLLSSNILMNLILIVYLLREVLITHKILGSDFIAAYNAVTVVMNAIMQIIMLCGQISASAFTIKKYQDFIEDVPEENRGMKDVLEDIQSIEFVNVSFAYPGTEKKVLKNINFKINAGDKIAIVGKNGSGKTTLVHLMMGLYYPTEGKILVNGKALHKEEYPLYRNKFAAFFQGMKALEATAAENVALDTKISLEKVKASLLKSGYSKLAVSPDTTSIGVQFDKKGTILSGGEYQKLMLAHCFYSEKKLLIMDEPSSALDPIAEKNFNMQIAELAHDKLAVFVTHRHSTVNMADVIYVIDNGKLCDIGTHQQLLNKEGVYKEMWNIQTLKYGVQ